MVVSLLVIRVFGGGLAQWVNTARPSYCIQLSRPCRRLPDSFCPGLEVGFVPAVAAQAKAWDRQQLLQRWRFAGRTIGQRRGADLLQHLHPVIAGSTLIVIKGHGRLSSTTTLAARAAKSGIIYGKQALRSPPGDQRALGGSSNQATQITRTSPLKFRTPPWRRCTSRST